MIEVEINPSSYEEEYIRYSNICFNGWGGNKEYEWALKRQVGNLKSDIMIVKEDNGSVLAGSSVTYRKIKTKSSSIVDIAIMTGSWTLPEARGKGCFSKIIEISKEVALNKNVNFLTAFVMESNASFRRLKSAGSLLVPTNHLFSPEGLYLNSPDISLEIIDDANDIENKIYQKYQLMNFELMNFHYDYPEFVNQYIKRITKPEIVRVGKDYAILEETYNAIKLLFITYDSILDLIKFIKVLSNWAQVNKSKKLLVYSTNKCISDLFIQINFQPLSGYFTVLNTSEKYKEFLCDFYEVNINMGDKM